MTSTDNYYREIIWDQHLLLAMSLVDQVCSKFNSFGQSNGDVWYKLITMWIKKIIITLASIGYWGISYNITYFLGGVGIKITITPIDHAGGWIYIKLL